MAVIEKQQFVFTSAGLNSNKCWIIELHDNGDVVTSWGRIGDSLQKKSFPGLGKVGMEKKIREKTKPSSHYDGGCYRKVDTLDSTSDTSITVKGSLKEIAKKQITSCKVTSNLIEYFTDVNAHNIAAVTGNKIKYNVDAGVFKTPLGVVTKDNIDKARALLEDIAEYVQKKNFKDKFIKSLEDYLMLIPQEVGRKFNPVLFIGDQTKIQNQNTLLDGLDSSYASVIAAPKSNSKDDKDDSPKIFDVKMSVLEDKNEWKRIQDKYAKSNKDMHLSSRLKLKQIYTVDISTNKDVYNGCKLDNENEFFHGTKASNCLSILKAGLIIPPSTASYVCGRAFGNGVYSSPISSKALNYATSYWGGRDEGRYFMFVVDFKMGKVFTPKSYYGSYPATGYDSTWAKPSASGVLNDECIVYKTNQVLLKYLMEFSK